MNSKLLVRKIFNKLISSKSRIKCKTLVLEYQIKTNNINGNNSKLPLLAVLDSTYTINLRKLSIYLNASSLVFSSRNTAEAITKQKIGTISPLEHSIRIIIDKDLMNNDVKSVIVGSGSESNENIEISINELVNMTNGEVVSISNNIFFSEVSAALPTHNGASKSEATITDGQLVTETMSKLSSAISINELVNMTNGEVASNSKDILGSEILSTALPTQSCASESEATVGDDQLDIPSPMNRLYTAIKFSDSQEKVFDLLNTIKFDNILNSYNLSRLLGLAVSKGMIDIMKHLIDLGANVNLLNVSEGNNGKTAIFYAITHARDNVVVELLSMTPRAKVKIINNKGQSPRSLAASHLNESTILLIEKCEIEETSDWINCYKTSRDGKIYDNLDPRFFAVGENDVVKYDPTGCIARSINPVAYEFRRKHQVEKICEESHLEKKVKLIQKEFVTETLSLNDISSIFYNNNDDDDNNNNNNNHDRSRFFPGFVTDVPYTLLVDDSNKVQIFCQIMSQISNSNRLEYDDDNSSDMLEVVGIDCEWQPNDFPVSILQICSRYGIFILDLQLLYKMGHISPNLINCLSILLTKKSILKIGLAITEDFERLAASFPTVSCFTEIRNFIDIRNIFNKCFQFENDNKSQMIGLKKLSQQFLGKPLNKSQQKSRWSKRPLSYDQVVYAALDAAASLGIFDAMKVILKENNQDLKSVFIGKDLKLQIITKKELKNLKFHNSVSYSRYLKKMQLADGSLLRVVLPSLQRYIMVLPPN
eukprot:gene12130-16239_t